MIITIIMCGSWDVMFLPSPLLCAFATINQTSNKAIMVVIIIIILVAAIVLITVIKNKKKNNSNIDWL